MATLTVLKFSTPTGADQALKILGDLQKQQLITVEDAATVSWPEGKKGPKTHQAANMMGIGALDGAFWGMLFGLLFFVPFFGLAIGAGIGALTGKFSDFGIDDKFIKEVQSQVVEGTSALFVMTSNAVVERVIDSLKGDKPEVIATNLPKDKEDALKEAFSNA
jgi:uncharacterized membrane protein